MKNYLKLNSFWLRIIALVTMTIDHIGVLFELEKVLPLRIIGRLAYPIFMFLTVEGALKTSNKKKYIFRLSLLAILTGIALTVMFFMDGAFKQISLTSGNIFIDLLLTVLTITIFESKNKKIKPLAALPIAYIIFSAIVIKLEGCGCDGIYYWLFPAIRTQYCFYSLLGLGFYLAKKIAPLSSPLSADPVVGQALENAFCSFTLILVGVAFILINMAFGEKYAMPLDPYQSYAMLAAIPIFFYNGQKGYNAKWFKIAYYLYYPIHIGIIGLITFIIL